MILACSHISKAFGTDEILNDATFHIEEHEKAAIVGINGAGKSTLLKIIMGEMSADAGEVTIAKGKTIGYLAQHQSLSEGTTIYETLRSVRKEVFELEDRLHETEEAMKHADGDRLEALYRQYDQLNHSYEQLDGYACRSELTGVLKGLGFSEDEFQTPVDTLSGGQKTRVSLGCLLLTRPDVLLLDEPTNHLDLSSITWLETFLRNYSGAVVIVSHDRYFLNRVVTKVIEIENSHVTTFAGDYTAYAQKKAMLREIAMKQYLNQQAEIRHQEEVIAKLKSFNREKSIKRAESREKALEKIERVEKPEELDDSMKLELEPCTVSGNDVLTVRGLSKAFDELKLFENVDFDIHRGERVAIIGNNGTGKTTMLKIINGLLEADAGEIRLGSKVFIGYYDQEHHVLHMEKTLFEELQDTYPDMNNTRVRNILAAFLFTGDDVYKHISELSGGERGRVSLAKLMLSDSNFLILDEPTNHLDIVSKEILEEALKAYKGTVLYVSHDRYFINSTATRILDLTGHSLINYIGNYDYYLEKKDELSKAYLGTSSDTGVKIGGASKGVMFSAQSKNSDGKAQYQSQREQQAKERKLKNAIKKVEDAITDTEEKIAAIDEKMASPECSASPSRLMKLQEEKDELEVVLEGLYDQWSELSEEE